MCQCCKSEVRDSLTTGARLGSGVIKISLLRVTCKPSPSGEGWDVFWKDRLLAATKHITTGHVA